MAEGKILIVDDEQVIRELFTEVLGKKGYEVVTAKDGNEALNIFTKGVFNLVMMDIMLPGANGVKVLKQLKEVDPDVEGMIVTGYASLESAIEALEDGVSEYITKPFDKIEDVVRVVDRLVEKQKLTIENKRLQEETKTQRDELKRRVFELGVLYDVSDAIGYTLDYKELLRLIMSSLGKGIAYDLAASFLITPTGGDFILRPTRHVTKGFMEVVTDSVVKAIASLEGSPIGKDIRIDAVDMPQPEKDEQPIDKVNSYFNIPLIVKDKVIGMINVSSSRENAFGPGEIKLLYTLSNQAAGAIEKLRGVIAAEKSKMESMVESMAEGIVMTDHTGELVVINPTARMMLGFKHQEDVTGDKLKNSFKDIGIAKLFGKGIGFAEEEEEEEEEELRLDVNIPGPPERILRATQSLVKDEEEHKLGYVTILRDVTKERELDRLKDEFVSSVSHELRTPLTTIKGVISNALRGVTGDISDSLKSHLGIANDEIDRLSRIINDLLDVSKIEAGRMELKRGLVDIVALSRSSLNSFKELAKVKNIKLKGHFPDNPTPIFVDPDRITQVLSNLIGNAVKFTPNDGSVAVGIEDVGEEIQVSVTDTGPGIAKENSEFIFERFRQVGEIDGSKTKGTGLGLPIARQLVEMHGGKIWVRGELKQGATFTFTLPKCKTKAIFKEYLNNGMKQAMKNGTSLSLVVVRVVDFKRVEAEIGPVKGDQVLQEIGNKVESLLRRKGDRVSRYEDGEVVVILDAAGKEDAIAVEKRIRKELKGYKVPYGGRSKKVDFTFGVLTYPEEAPDEESIIEVISKIGLPAGRQGGR